jgi:maleylacetate reductase
VSDPAILTYQSLPSRVLFGKGALGELGALAAELGARRVMIVCTRSQQAVAARAQAILGEAARAVFAGAVMHTPVEVTEAALKVVQAEGIDGLVAIGGGSAIGLAKALALRTDLPQIAVPSTYAGSEMTPILGQTEAGRKTTQRSPKVLPEAVIYDVELSLSLPLAVSVTSGFNAMAHAVEGLYAKSPNPLLLAVSEEAVRVMAHALPHIVIDPLDEAARSDALEGAWLGGWALAHGGSALHHRICHVLGGAFDLPHAETHTILLPQVLAYNAPAAPEAMLRLERALAGGAPAEALFDLASSLGAPRALKGIGLPEAGIDQAMALILADPPWNPRPIEEAPLRDLLRRAWAGEPPRVPRPRRGLLRA